jgi:hypothetical protein
MPSSRVIHLRWPDSCAYCGRALASHERTRWDPIARQVTCLACGGSAATQAQAAGETRGISGASARREYERRRDAQMRRARERLGLLGMGMAWVAGDPAPTRAWRRGAEGEVKVAQRLEKLLAGKEVSLLHDRLLTGSTRANIDHIAVGPGGVTVIDAKNLHGKVRVERSGGLFGPSRSSLRVERRDRTGLIRGVERQAEAVQEVITQASLQAEVRAALCMASTDGLPLFGRLEVNGVLVAGASRVAKLAARPGTLTAEQRRELLGALSSGLPVA